MATIPTLEAIQNAPSGEDSPLSVALTILFEHSPTLISQLEPQLSDVLKTRSSPLASYSQLIDVALAKISNWNAAARSEFISGHPRIGESKNLSNLSAKEQGAQGVKSTPPEVLARLAHLNACYEAKYPGLRYITFVNGRSRATIAEEMEGVLGLEHSLSPDTPAVDALDTVDVNTPKWRSELDRAVRDIGLIAKSRLGALGVQ